MIVHLKAFLIDKPQWLRYLHQHYISFSLEVAYNRHNAVYY